ncbi:MAG: hypothetical protein RIC56_11690 [Pseudomonadales bacterium]
MTDLVSAVTHLERRDWEAAHRIVQEDEAPLACWAHGIVHLMEGDEGNAGYWYRRAGRALPAPDGRRIPAEIRALSSALAQQQ